MHTLVTHVHISHSYHTLFSLSVVLPLTVRVGRVCLGLRAAFFSAGVCVCVCVRERPELQDFSKTHTHTHTSSHDVY